MSAVASCRSGRGDIMKILVGVDESKHADTTLKFVAGMSWPKDVSVIVVSAVQLPLGAYGEAYAPVAVDTGLWMEELTKLHREVVARAAETLRGAGLATEARVQQIGRASCRERV